MIQDVELLCYSSNLPCRDTFVIILIFLSRISAN